MKNIQVIDGALNATFQIYQIDDADFFTLFPAGAEIEFTDSLVERVGANKVRQLYKRIWRNPQERQSVCGIQGTLFVDMSDRMKFFPDRTWASVTRGTHTFLTSGD